MTNTLVQFVIVVAVLLCLWLALEYFSPHPLITQICKIIIFVVALLYAVKVLLPMVA